MINIMENINKNNYEVWMFDYLEGNLDNNKTDILFNFLDENPHLKEDLELFQSTMLIPEDKIFKDKYKLLKSTDLIIDMPESDYLLIKRMEEGLTEQEHIRLAELGNLFPVLKNDYKAYKKTKLKPQQIIFPKKSSLLRKNIRHYIWTSIGSIAVAAAILFFILKPVDKLIDNKEYDLISGINNLDEIIIEKSVTEEIKKTELLTVKEIKKDKDLLTKNINFETEPKVEETFFANNEIVEPIPLQPFKPLLNVQKINVYEKGLSIMIPLYLENLHLIQALKTDSEKEDEHAEKDEEPERLFLFKATEKLMSRIISRYSIFEWS